MEAIRNIRNIDAENIMIKVPKEFLKKRVEIIIRPLDQSDEDVRESWKDVLEKQEPPAESGLCGIWDDERTPDEIIDDIYSHRSGYGGRQVNL